MGAPLGRAMVMARPAHGVRGGDAPIMGQALQGQGMVPPSPLRNALQMLHTHLLFNEEEGIEVSTALSSIREKLDVSPHFALGEAVRLGLVEEYTDFGRLCVRRGPRSDEALRRIYGGEPPTREGIMARARAWDEYFDAKNARLGAIREFARPKEHNTAASLPAWMP